MAFFDDLASLCAREMASARKAGNSQRKAEVVEGLATILGRTIAMAADGDPRAVDELLIGSDGYAAREAVEFSKLVQFTVSCQKSK